MSQLIQSITFHTQLQFTVQDLRRLFSSIRLRMHQLTMAPEPWTDWHTSVCDCFEDASTCCYGFWCCPCLACRVSSRFGENTCLPLCDLCSLSLTAAIGIPLFGPPPAVLALRASVRNRYKIKGSLCKDVAASCFCAWCSWCQILRELNYRRNKPTIINIVSVQPASAMQPNPVIHTYPLHSGVLVGPTLSLPLAS